MKSTAFLVFIIKSSIFYFLHPFSNVSRETFEVIIVKILFIKKPNKTPPSLISYCFISTTL